MSDLLIEIGCEELPAVACREAEEQLPGLLGSALEAAGLTAGSTTVYVAPRRLVAIAHGLPEAKAAERVERRGPRADAPEQAREGFAKRNGLTAAELVEREGFLWALSEGEATPAAELVAGIVEAIAGGLQFSKTMRWDEGRFSRPVRWLVALLDGEVAAAQAFGLQSGNHSYGHRVLGGEVRLSGAAHYLEQVRSVKVVADAAERRELIEDGLNAVGEWIDPMGKMNEVVHLVEWPSVHVGRFDDRYLQLPLRVPVTAMQSHQRYFPLVSNGALEPRFAFVANGGDPEVVIRGNEDVLVGRLEDAAFAYRADVDRGLDTMLGELDRVSFLEGSGSLADKAVRVRALAAQLCERVDAEPEVRDAVLRAAELCKADLVSGLVAEFSDLQGYAGSVYARLAGEPAAVCDAIEEHHMPVEASGALPMSPAGALLAIADKADTVAVAFALGAQPTGSRDPYGLRRAAAGIVAIALDRGFELGLAELAGEAIQLLVSQGRELRRKPLEAVPDAVDFVLDRVEPVVAADGVTVEEMRAARGSGVTGPVPLAALSRALHRAAGSEHLAALKDAYGRCGRIAAKAAGEAAMTVDRSLFVDPAERELCAALTATDIEIADNAAQRDYDAALIAAGALVEPITRFFEQVLVMDPQKEIRANRLKLVTDVATSLRLLGDFEQLPG